jgi:hypothetical protein
MMLNDVARQLASMISRRAQFRIEDGHLKCRAPQGALSAGDRAFIAEHKSQIVQLLTIPESAIHEHIWWMDHYWSGRLLWIPPRVSCHAPKACSRLGPCPFFQDGEPCEQTVPRQEADAA